MYSILVVDDEANIRRVLATKLRRAGYRVVVAATGEDAKRAVDEQSIAAVLTDLRMPGVDGFALLEHVRERAPATPVIMGSTTP